MVGAALISYEGNSLYALVGGDSPAFYRYDISGDTWSQRADLPAGVGEGGSLAWGGEHVYALRGGGSQDFCRYAPASNSWDCSLADAPYGIYAGADLEWDGRDWIYATAGGNGKHYLRYHIPSNQCEILGDGNSSTPDDDIPAGVDTGGGLARIGNNMYGLPGGGTAELWRYDPVGLYPEKLTLDQVAFVAPETAAAPNWYNLPLAMQPDDFNIVGSDNAWVGGSGTVWSPDPGTDPPLTGSHTLTHAQADFSDAPRDVHRLGDASTLAAGYHTYRPDAWVAADSSEEFTSLQAAIDSGANRVLVRPGVYPEPIYLVSGVEVFGSGADQTIIEPGGGTGGALVSAEGIVGAGLARLTLNGDGQGVDGLRVEDGAQSFTFARSIVRGADTGITVDGADTDLEVVNNTIVENTTGMTASDCAPVDVRNTIFAYHSGTGLAYEGCAATQLHSYNLYWENGTDLNPAEPGAGELFLDPLFVDRWDYDYRTRDDSPVIDAGNPSDPFPPGAGDRVDIGYVEQGRASFYADDDYCETCPNDGLTWGLDAFDLIQDALDAAADSIHQFTNSQSTNLQSTVGVGPGVYNETVTVPSYVRLIGSGAEDTTIDSLGSGVPVTFDGVVHAEVSGFTIAGAGSSGAAVSGASNAITITRNILRDNPTGIAFSERATGLVSFNTLVNNGMGIAIEGLGTWATVENNILADNTTGLRTTTDGQLFNDYNLLYNTTNYEGIAQGLNEIVGMAPLFEDAAGGGARSDLGYREVLAAPLSLFLGDEDASTALGNSGVDAVEVGISLVADPSQPVTTTLPATWEIVTLESPGETATYWGTDYTPADEGLYRFYSRAADVVDNRETEADDWYEGAFVADSTAPVVDWLAPTTACNAPVELRAQVSDYAGGAFSVDDFYFEVDGCRVEAEWAAEPWDADTGVPRVFRTWIALADGGHSLRAAATDRAGNAGQSSLVNLTISGQDPADIAPPALTIDSPAPGGWVRQQVTFSGTASDSESGLASVEVSVDGGCTWLPASVTGTDWELIWEAPAGQEFVSHPAQVRATDRAGNVTVTARPITVDNLAPTGLAPVTFSAPPETHFDALTVLTITWNTPVDGSGTAFSLLAVDQVTDTTPTQVVSDTSAAVLLAVSGDWYVHLAAQDAAGNQFTRHYGPWHMGTFEDSGTPFDHRQQSIVIDGYLDLLHGEWTSGEFLDDDERINIQNPNFDIQSLYATWDGAAFYLGWQGAGGAWMGTCGPIWIPGRAAAQFPSVFQIRRGCCPLMRITLSRWTASQAGRCGTTITSGWPGRLNLPTARAAEPKCVCPWKRLRSATCN